MSRPQAAPGRVSIAGLLQAGAAVTAVVSLATLFDSLHRLVELFSHFRLQYFVLSVLLAAGLALLRHPRWSGAMLLLTAVNAWPLAPWYLGESAPSEAGRQSLRVLHANLYSANDDTAALRALVEAERPDLIFLQEVTPQWQATVAMLQQEYPHGMSVPREDNFGLAVLSRTPLAVETLASPPHGFPTLRVSSPVDGVPLTVVSTHPMPPLGASGFDARNIQLQSIADRLAGIDGPVVLIGDLNTTMWGKHYRQLVAATGLRDARTGFGVLPTWPVQLPLARIPIDHCLVSEEIVVDIRTGSEIGSDHLPLIADLALAAPD